MTRAGFRAGAVALVVVLLAGLGWMFLAPKSAPVAGDRAEAPVRKPATESGQEAEARAAVAPRSAAEGAAPRIASSDSDIVLRKEEPGIPGVCVLEDGTPLAGVKLSIRELPDREENSVWVEDETGPAGTFAARADRTVEVEHRWARAVAVEGGVLLEGGKKATLRTAAEATAVRILFRDDPGMAHVRLLDSSTLGPLTSVRGLRLTYLFGRELSGRAVYDYPEDTVLGGWIPIREGALPENLGVEADPAGVVVEFSATGYAPKRVPLPDIRGRMTVRVDPVPPCVVGGVGVGNEPLEIPNAVIAASLHPQEASTNVDTTGVRGLPTKTGPFQLDDLPQGAWELELTLTCESSTRRTRRSFEYRGTPVDLGMIRFTSGETVRARAVDSAGEPIPQARVVVVLPGEDAEKAKAPAPDSKGWVTYSDLEANREHRVVALGMPRPLDRMTQTAADGSPVSVELQWPDRLVPCRIVLQVDGKAVANPGWSRTIPATVHESPLPREADAWSGDGTFSAKLVPGTYRFSAWATPEGGGDLALFGAEVTVPSGDAFETRLELVRETR